MTPDEFREYGHRLIDWIADYRATIAARPVRATTEPGEVRASLPAEPPTQPQPLDAILADFESLLVPGLTHWQHPRFFGYFPANSALAERPGRSARALTGLGVTEPRTGRRCPAATELEELVCDWVRQMVGLSAAWSGVIHDTASTVSLIALLCARERATNFSLARGGMPAEPKPLTIYASTQSHSSVEKAALLAGFGRENVRAVSVDDRLRDARRRPRTGEVRADVAQRGSYPVRWWQRPERQRQPRSIRWGRSRPLRRSTTSGCTLMRRWPAPR